MGLFDRFKKHKEQGPLFLYSGEELEAVDSFISETIGNFDNVFHEIISPDIHLDVCFVKPSDDEPYYKLVTIGAGAYKMGVPDKWKEYNIEHAEYIICVPKDWDINSSEIEDYWPIKLLKDVARLPIWCDTWLSFGHTTQADEEGTPYAPNVRFNSVILGFANNAQGDVRLMLPSGKAINFYQLTPLYPEELKYKMENGADALFELFEKKGIDSKVIDPNRESVV